MLNISTTGTARRSGAATGSSCPPGGWTTRSALSRPCKVSWAQSIPIAGVLLSRVGFHHYTLVHVGAVIGIGVLRMVGMDRVGVVRAEHEAGRDGPQVVLLPLPQGEVA